MPLCLIGFAISAASKVAFQVVGIVMAAAVSLPLGSSIEPVTNDPASAPAAAVQSVTDAREDAVAATGASVAAPSAADVAAKSTRVVAKVREIAARPAACTAAGAAGTATTTVGNITHKDVAAALPSC